MEDIQDLLFAGFAIFMVIILPVIAWYVTGISIEKTDLIKANFFVREVASSIDRLSGEDSGQRELIFDKPLTIEFFNKGGIACDLGISTDCGLHVRAAFKEDKIEPVAVLGSVNFGDRGTIILNDVKTVCMTKNKGKEVEVSEICEEAQFQP